MSITSYAILLLQAPETGGKESFTQKIIIVFISALVGFIVKILQQRFADGVLSVSQILEKEKKGIPLRPIQQKRIHKVTLEAFKEWQKNLAPPTGLTEKKKNISFLIDPNISEISRLRIPLDLPLSESQCPIIPADVPLIYFNTYDLAPGKYQFDTIQLVLLIHEKLVQQKTTYLLSDQLIKKYLSTALQVPLKIWIKIPNYLVKDNSDTSILLQSIENELNNWFSNFIIVAELYYSKDIFIGNTTAHLLPADYDLELLNSDNLKFAYARNYTLKRNSAFNYISSNKLIGRLILPKLIIPYQVLEEQLQTMLSVDLSKYDVVSINGNPGSGKTETIDLWLKDCNKNGENLFIACSDPSLLEIIENINRYKEKEQFLKAILTFSEILLPIKFAKDLLTVESFSDVLYNKLSNPYSQFALVIDDLDSFSNLEQSLIKNIDTFKSWRIKLILISRSEITFPTTIRIKTVQFAPWNKTQAIQILQYWNPTINLSEENIQILLRENEKILSSYLLRIIANRNENSADINSMLKGELTTILEPFNHFVNAAILSPERLVEEIKMKLNDPTTTLESIQQCFFNRPEISIIGIFSQLAWHSKFNINPQKINDGNKERGYKSDLITPLIVTSYIKITTDQAKEFLSDCIKLKIMSGNPESAFLSDKLVPDGCIAIDLKNRIRNGLEPEILWAQLSNLLENNSSDFFKFTLDLSTVNSLFGFPQSLQNDGLRILNRLLTLDVIERLSHETVIFDKVTTSLLNFCNQTEQTDKKPLFQLLSKFFQFSNYLQFTLQNYIETSYNIETAANILCMSLDQNDFIGSYKSQLSKNILLSTISNCWINDNSTLIIQFIFEQFDDDNATLVKDNFTNWCKNQPLSVIVGFHKKFLVLPTENLFILKKWALLKVITDEIHQAIKDKINTISLNASSNEFKSEVKTNLRLNINSLLDDIHRNTCDDKEDKKAFLTSLIYWLSFFQNPDLSLPFGAEYIIFRSNADLCYYAIPKTPRPAKSIAEIIATIETGFPHFRLARSKEILGIKEEELVHDKFPRDYNYSNEYKLPGYSYQSFNGSTLSGIDHRILSGHTNTIYYWRAVLKL